MKVALLSLVVWLSSVPALAQREVDPGDVSVDPAPYVEETLLLKDRLSYVTRTFMSAEEEAGYRADSHIKLWLSRSDLRAFLPKTPENLAKVKKLTGKPVRVVGTLRNVGTGKWLSIGEVNLHVRGHEHFVLDVTSIDAAEREETPYLDQEFKAARYTQTDPTSVQKKPADFLDQSVRFDVVVERPFYFSRTFSQAEHDAGFTRFNTVRLPAAKDAGLVPGVVVSVRRMRTNVAVVTALEAGDKISLFGRVVIAEGDQPVFAVDRVLFR